MILKSLTSPKLLFTKQNFRSKEETIKYLIKKLADEGKLHSEEDFYQAVIDREKLSPTGFEGGLAIPHGKSGAVKEAAFAIATLQKLLTDWESIDPTNEVELVILLAIPENESGSTHLSLLSEFVTRLSNEEYKNRLLNAKSNEELFGNLDQQNEKEVLIEAKKAEKTVLAITACPAGIAHTYMAAEALVKAGKELGVDVFVEKQGANGIEDRHTKNQLRKADAVIFAVDVAVKDEERYRHLPKVKTTVAQPLKNAKGILSQALEKADKTPKKEYADTNDGSVESDDTDKKSFKTEIKDSILTGISYIIPVIVAGGMTLAFAVLVSQAFGLQDVYAEEGTWLWLLRQLGGTLLGTLMVPILSAYMAYSIADKPALGPGFAAGVAANLIGSGFLGGMLGGILAGYQNGTLNIFNKQLNKQFENVLLLENCGDDGDEYDFSPLANDKIIYSNEVDAKVDIKQTKHSATIDIQFKLGVPSNLTNRKEQIIDSAIDIHLVLSISNHKPVIEVKFDIDNHAGDHRLRAFIPTNIASSFSISDNQFGFIKRDVYDTAMDVWEKEDWDERPDSIYPMLSFVGLSNEDYGVSVLTNSTREYEIVGANDDTIAITLFRSVGVLGKEELLRRPGRPSGIKLPTPDSQMLGKLSIDFAIVTHEKSVTDANVERMAKEYLTPIHLYNKIPHDAMKLNKAEVLTPLSYSFIKELQPEAVLSTLKKSEKEDQFVLRFYNPTDVEKTASFKINRKVSNAYNANLNEKPIAVLKVFGNEISTNIKKNQVQTILF